MILTALRMYNTHEEYLQAGREYITKIIKRQEIITASDLEQQKNLLEEISDYAEILAIYEKDNEKKIRDNIDVSAHINDAPASNYRKSDPVQVFSDICEMRIKQYENQIVTATYQIYTSNKRIDDVYMIRHITNVLQAVIPAHYYVISSLWIKKSGTYKQLSYELNIAQKKIQQMLVNFVEAVLIIIEVMDRDITIQDITPYLLNQMLARNKIYELLKKNER